MASIIMVGSGVAGATLARQLLKTENEHQITVFEAGPDFKPGDYRIWLDRVMADNGDLYEDFVDDPRTENEHFGLRGSRLFVKGGTTNHWGGLTPRFKPEDFELKSRTGFGVDWPISYEDMAPYYAEAEILLGITGDSDNDDPPRYGAKYPFPPTDFTLGDVVIVCSGTIESAKLLLSSANEDWTRGIGNDSGHVGRHLIGHPVMFVSGVRPGNPDKVHEELGFDSLISRHFDSPEYQHKGKMWFSGSAGSNSSLERHILSNVSRAEMDSSLISEMRISLGGEMEQFESPQSPSELGKRYNQTWPSHDRNRGRRSRNQYPNSTGARADVRRDTENSRVYGGQYRRRGCQS